MKASLQLKYSQNLTMTPQLQQAIKLLQLSSLELQQEIQSMLETNPLLENDEQLSAEPEQGHTDNLDPSADFADDQELKGEQFEQYHTENMFDLSPRDLNEDALSDPSQNNLTDNDHDSLYYQSVQGQGDFSQSGSAFEAINSSERSLSEYLLEQLNLCKITERDLNIAYLIIESLDERGYLRQSPQELLDTLNSNISAHEEAYESDELFAVLHRVQQFEPSGIAAQDLRECLLLQLTQFPDTQPGIQEARELVSRYLHHLESKDFNQIRRKTHFSESALTEALKIIKSLNPDPASQVLSPKTDYIIPDIIVRKSLGRWRAELNETSLPKIRINAYYASLLNNKMSKSDKQFLKNNLQEAKWFIKSLHSRHETLLKVANEIIEVQQNFFEHGEQAMKPLVLHDIAERVGMHESTISRVTNQKYMLTPKGVFELKYFFSSHVANNDGNEHSSTAIRAHIKKLIAEENRKKPLSDSKIAKLLATQDIHVARRTIAKYRESLSIPPSNERKQLL